MYRLSLIYLLIGISTQSVFAQFTKIDSLRATLANHPQSDTFRVNRLIDWAIELNNLIEEKRITENRSDSVASQILSLSQRLNYPYGKAQALYNLARPKIYTQPKVAQQLLIQALVVAQPLNNNVLLTNILRMMGHSYMSDGNRALPYYQQALARAKATEQPALIARAMDDLGIYYAYRFMYAPALSWYFQALKVIEKTNFTENQVVILHGIAGVYLDIADYDRALTYLQNALSKVGPASKSSEIILLGDIGNCYLLTKRYTRAIMALQQGIKASKAYKERPGFYELPLEANLVDAYERQGNALALPLAHKLLANARQYHDTYVINRVSITLGRYYLRTSQADSAIYYAQQVIQFSQQNQNKIRLRDAMQILAGAYANHRDYASAYAYQTRYMAYKDSITNEQVSRKATAAQFDDQMSRQQNQIALLRKDKQLQIEETQHQSQLLYISLVVIALITTLLLLLFRIDRHKQLANVLLQQQKAEIQSHWEQAQQALAELKETQIQLVQKEKMASLGELTAGIAHEIQNPLNFVNNFSEVSTDLVDELSEGPLQHLPASEQAYVAELLEDLTSNLRKITHHGQRASNIVRGMLEHSRNSTGDVRPTEFNILVKEYLKIAYQSQRAKDKEFSCDLVIDIDPTIGLVEIVPQEIGRVLLNLFTNAFYAVRQRQKQDPSNYQPMITISTLKTTNGIEIRVRDNGIGMAKSVQEKIFQPFFTTKPTGEGTGLGLSLSYDIVTKGHGGSLWVESQLGEGTQLTVHLPANNHQPA